MEYKIKKPFSEVGGKNEFDSVIEISGLTSDVTVNYLLDHLENVEKTKKEQIAQAEVNRQLNEKAIEALPMLKDIPEDKIDLAFSFVSKSLANRQTKAILETCENTIKTYRTHLENIEKSTGINCLPVISPIQKEEIKK